MLDNKLIENALALTGKNIFSVESCNGHDVEFSIEKFCYYLLSPEFIEKYYPYNNVGTDRLPQIFGEAIWLYQHGKEEYLIELLS